MNIILLGMPGSGKGTQAEMLTKEFALYYFQAGKLARELAKKDPEINRIVNSGKLIPEATMTKLVFAYLERKVPNAKDILFEGYPRFIPQYEYLKKWVENKGQVIDSVIFLEANEEDVIKRLAQRRICTRCDEVYNLVTNPPPKTGCKCGGKLVQRDDDRPEAIKQRFSEYDESTKDLIEHLEFEKVLIRVDGMQSIEKVSKSILIKMGKKLNV